MCRGGDNQSLATKFDISAVGQTLSDVRKRQNKTQEELSLETGITLRTIGRVERGQGNPTIKTIKKIAEALDCKISIEISTRDL